MTRSVTQFTLARLRASARCQFSTDRSYYGQSRYYGKESSPQSERAQEIDSSLRNRKFNYSEHLSVQPMVLLRNAFTGYLPPPLESDGDDACHNLLHLGYQHLFFRPPLTAGMICSDGTDTKFLPGPESVWKYRLWAGGSVRYLRPFPYTCHPSSIANLTETASEINVVDRNGRADKIFVTINRRVDVSKSSLIQSQDRSKSSSATQQESNSSVGLVETERICFLRDPPASLQDKRRIKPPSNPMYTHTMTPTRSLLFQFSALTYNAHSIHLDRELARQEYGAEDLIVHGPLTMVLMLEFLRITLQRAAGLDRTSANRYFVPMAINYVNLHALYVDRPLTLCCRPSSPRTSGLDAGGSQSWQVWVQVGDEANASCAVKGTIELETIQGKDLQLDKLQLGIPESQLQR